MRNLLQITPRKLGARAALVLAATLVAPALLSAQSITVELVDGTIAGCSGLPVDIVVSASGLNTANVDYTLGSGTIDVVYENGILEPTATEEPIPSPPYLPDINLLPDLCSVPACTAIRTGISSASVGNGLGEHAGVEVGSPTVVEKICFDFLPGAPAAAASKSEAVLPAFYIDPNTLSIGLYETLEDSSESAVIFDCRTPEQGSSGTIGFDCTITNLAVELTGFTALVQEQDVVLSWSTATETNNAGFSVEHATADEPFAEVTFVEGAGNTVDRRNYTYTVRGLDVGTHRFRLKQVDFDGAFTYSQVVEATIELAGTHRLSAAYPNPFNPSTTFELVVNREQRVKIDIINALGQRVQRLFDGQMEANKPTNFTFRAGILPTGLYFYRVIGENFAETRQVLLVK